MFYFRSIRPTTVDLCAEAEMSATVEATKTAQAIHDGYDTSFKTELDDREQIITLHYCSGDDLPADLGKKSHPPSSVISCIIRQKFVNFKFQGSVE